MGRHRAGIAKTYDDGQHAQPVFSAGEKAGEDENYYVDWDRCDGKVKFDVGCINHYNDELDGEAEEEEKVKFEESNVDLMLLVCENAYAVTLLAWLT